MTTDINGTDEEIKDYFKPGKWFNLHSEDEDLMAQVIKVEVI